MSFKEISYVVYVHALMCALMTGKSRATTACQTPVLVARAKFFKNLYIFSYLEFYIFFSLLLVCEKICLQIFILLRVNVKFEPKFLIPEILRWGQTGRFGEKRNLT